MATLCVSELLTVLETRRDHFRKLLELSRQQIELIAADNYTQLLETLGNKQRSLGHLDELTKQFPNLKQQCQLLRGTGDAVFRDDCEHVLAETEAILAELLKEERESTHRLTERRDNTKQQLHALSQGTEVHTAYRDTSPQTTHRFLDVDQ